MAISVCIFGLSPPADEPGDDDDDGWMMQS